MIRNKLAAAVSAAVMMIAGSATASTTIDFDDVSTTVMWEYLPSYTSHGMLFTSAVGTTVSFPPDGSIGNALQNIDVDGTSIHSDQLVTSVDGGGTFDLLGFTFGWRRPAEANPEPFTGNIYVRFLYGDGRDETENFAVHTEGPEVVSLSRTGLRQIMWLKSAYFPISCTACIPTLQSNPYVLDDIIVDNITPGVPEPATWAMMIMGFAGTGAMIRRRSLQLRQI